MFLESRTHTVVPDEKSKTDFEVESWREELASLLRFGENRIPGFGSLFLEIYSRTMTDENRRKVIRLSPMEYLILWMLVRAQGDPVPLRLIDNFIYADTQDNGDLPLSNTVKVLIQRLRKKLKDLAVGVSIGNEYVFGYFLYTDDGKSRVRKPQS